MATRSVELTSARISRRVWIKLWRRTQEISLGYLLLAPALVILIVFEFFPIFYGLYISACEWRIGCVKMIGLDNYTRAFGDPNMWRALWITVSYVVISVPLQLGLALVIAYLLFQNIRGKEALRVAFFLPYITSTVASAAVWSYLYSPDKGLINTIFKAIGLQPLRWLGEPTGIFAMMFQGTSIVLPSWAEGPSLALIALIVYTTWVFVGFDITIFLAGLGNIPSELYDAAKVDGASGWKLFRNVTLPLLSPTTFFLLTVTIIGTFRAFNHIYVMTRGGPVGTTATGSIFIFDQIIANRYGYSAALSFILFFVILIVTIIQHRISSSRVVYD